MYRQYLLKTKTMQSCAQTIRQVFKVIYIYIHVCIGKYIQFSTADDGVPRRNGLEHVKVTKKNQQYQHLQHISMFT